MIIFTHKVVGNLAHQTVNYYIYSICGIITRMQCLYLW